MSIESYLKDHPIIKTAHDMQRMCWSLYNIEPKVHDFIDFIYNEVEKPTPENVTAILHPLLKHLIFQDYLRQSYLEKKGIGG
ncbi:MAG: hypothetical protein V3U54_08555 [Thermodesulfobacteriota bacterium]